MRQGHNHVFTRDQVFKVDVCRLQHDFGATLVTKLGSDGNQFVSNDLRDAFWSRQDVEQIGDLLHYLAIFVDDLVLFQTGQALQAQFEDGLGLRVGQQITTP